MRFRPKKPLPTRFDHLFDFFLTSNIFWAHHAAVSMSFPIGQPSDTACSPSFTHFTPSGIRPCLYLPMASPSLFLTFSFIPVASHHLWSAMLAFFNCLQLRSARVVSSANCEMMTSMLPIMIPRTPSCWMAMYSPWATSRNSSGDSGHPCATPDRMSNHPLYLPLAYILLLGALSSLYMSPTAFAKYPSIPTAFIASLRYSYDTLSKAFSISRNRKIPLLLSTSSFIAFSIMFSNIVQSAMNVSGTKPFCASSTNRWTTFCILLANTRVNILYAFWSIVSGL